ncbi:MAG: BamA/TamA family outer membrane protein [Bacteroidota bacterium]|nr:BamA/TamA family outer membrane protein [Bacteroidota bacterium]
MKCLRLYKIVLALLIVGCSSTKYVPDGQYLLNKVKIVSDNKSINKESLKPYLRQTPNQRVFSVFRLQLGVYSLSGRDTTSWWNNWLKRAGEKPVIYDEAAAELSRNELNKEMVNRGYAKATVQTIAEKHKKKVNLTYKITSGEPYKIENFKIEIPNDSLLKAINSQKDPYVPTIKKGMTFDINALEKERTDLTAFLKQRGFYTITKDHFHFLADTTSGNLKANVSLKLRAGLASNDSIARKLLSRKIIRNVTFLLTTTERTQAYTAGTNRDTREKLDSLWYDGYRFLFSKRPLISCNSLISNTFIFPNSYYNDKMVEETYAALNALPPVKYVNVIFRERTNDTMDCIIVINPDKNQSFTVDVEGTNSGGNFGVAGDFSYQHRNIFKGAQLFKFHARYSYEALGSLSNLFSYNATELATDVSVKYPTFVFPFLGQEFKRGINASTAFTIGYNYQIRPEFTRTLANVGIKYAWSRKNLFYTFDLLNFNYIYLPPDRISADFKKTYLTNSSPLVYSYQSQMILRTGISINYNSQRGKKTGGNITNWRLGISEAGNLLNALCGVFNSRRDSVNHYRIFNLPFAQYVKGDFDFSYNQEITKDNHMVYHFALGVACPYGNAQIIPFEERYYAGGANGVRGWSSYTLGPGSYYNKDTDGKIDFVNKIGDINLLANLEYRFKIGWIFEGAAFTDAGNIWTIKNYIDQPGGFFRLSEFYKQIAWSYGLGLRMNFNYFVLRFDFGYKLFNPASGGADNKWIRPMTNVKKNMNMFFAIGYPF